SRCHRVLSMTQTARLMEVYVGSNGRNSMRRATETLRQELLVLVLALVLFGTAAAPLQAQTVTEFPIPSGFGSKAIATGPDGNLWFAEYLKVGRVTTSGAITLYDTPTFSAFNNGIAAGPDGNLWFTEQVGIIGRITLQGMITEFPLPGTW